MVSKTFNRYIWLLNILLQKKELTFEEIRNLWRDSNLGDGTPMPLRTFHQHRKAVEELFGVKISCNPSNGYHYSIDNPQALRNDKTRQWLLNSFTLSNIIIAGHNMNGRILFENIPGGADYLQSVVEAMQQNKILEIDYQAFGSHRETYHMEPYAMKVYRQRWYIIGKLKEQDAIRHLALDRIIELQKTDTSFTIPKNFNAEKYYANSIGIFVNEELKPQKVRIRVYGKQVDYLRTLPLHRSQEEVLTKHEQFSEFQYRVCLTPELSTQLLAMGEKVEVLEPQELREEIKKKIELMFNYYK
ncbi:MAG: WYL domain-containing protein [Prevotella sp.]|nr:WYL domain-containing protein [Prevotella sp.]